MTQVVKGAIMLLTALCFLIGGQSALAKDDKIKGPAETIVKAAEGAKIDINTADASTLTQIKGIGPVTAESIIAYRKEVGAFKSVDDLIQVKGIGEKTLEAIKPFVMVK